MWGLRGQAAERTVTATLPSSLLLWDVQLTALTPANPAMLTLDQCLASGCIAPSLAAGLAVYPSSQPPKLLAASPSSAVHPPCWHRATRWGLLSPSLGLQADGRHQLPAASLHDNLSCLLPFGDTPSHSQLIPRARSAFSSPWPLPESPIMSFLGEYLPKGHLSLPIAGCHKKRLLFPTSHGRMLGHKVPTVTRGTGTLLGA